MKNYILDEIDAMKGRKHISFHTPGHKGINTLLDWRDYVPFGDLTEVGNMDNLHNPQGIIRESQRNMSRIYKSKETLYLVNGTTGGIYIGLGSLTSPGDKVLIQRNSHRSVYNGCILNRLRPEYIYPNFVDGLTMDIDVDNLEDILKNDPDIKLLVLTSPNYYGISLDMERIVDLVRKYDRYLLVDEAHGSHLNFSNKLAKSSLDYGADIVVQSSHKTLPSLTQSSMLHVGTDRVDMDKLRSQYSLYQTTSPSYLMLLSLEMAGNYMASEGWKKLDENIDIIANWMDRCRSYDAINILDTEDKDLSKIVFSIDGYSGPELEKIFMEDGIYLEMSEEKYALALASVMNSQSDFDALFSKMIDLATNSKPRRERLYSSIDIDVDKARDLYETFYDQGELVDLEEAGGRIAKSFIIPYPPGVPLLVPGEVFSQELISHIRYLVELGIEVMGLEDGSVQVLV